MNPNLFGPILLDYRAPLTPTVWAQDTLVTPPGWGVMPDVDLVNAVNVRREYFCYSGAFNTVGSTLTLDGRTYNTTINFDPDGDFWISSIALSIYRPSTSLFITNYVGEVQITDNLANHNLFTPSVGSSALLANPMNRVNTAGAVNITNMMEPYCMRRGSSMTWTLVTSVNATILPLVFFAMSGWKEYENASS